MCHKEKEIQKEMLARCRLSCVTLSAGAEPVGCTSDLLLRECSCAGQITWALGKFTPKFTIHHHVILP